MGTAYLHTLVISHRHQHLSVLDKYVRIVHVLLKIIFKGLFGALKVPQSSQSTELIQVGLKILRNIEFKVHGNIFGSGNVPYHFINLSRSDISLLNWWRCLWRCPRCPVWGCWYCWRQWRGLYIPWPLGRREVSPDFFETFLSIFNLPSGVYYRSFVISILGTT
jgi:hypothetical protein